MFSKIYRRCKLALVICVAVYSLTNLSAIAETTIKARCPSRPANLKLMQRAIELKALNSVDSSKYKKISVSVKLHKAAKQKTIKEYSVETLLSGLTFTQSELTTIASGTLTFNDTCTYVYIAQITISAVNTATKIKLRTRTDSLVSITASGNFRVKSSS